MPGNRTSTPLVLLSAALAFTATISLAQSQGGADMQGGAQQPMGAQAQTGQANLSTGDKKFLMDAMQGDMAEIQLGQLALQKSTNPDIKQFAQKMVDDHTKLDQQVKPIAEQMGVTPPTALSPKASTLYAKLQSANGAEFDKQYAKAMVSDHREDDAEFKKEETSGKSQAVKDAATQGEPTIAEHLQMAEALDKKM